MNDDRALVLARIREALRVPRAKHADSCTACDSSSASSAESASSQETFSQWLPQVGEAFSDWVEVFRERSLLLTTEFILCHPTRLPQLIADLVAAYEWQRPALHAHPLVDRIRHQLPTAPLDVSGGYAVQDLEACDVSFTGCEALVAQTGSVLMSTRSSGGRALSVLPPHHVVLANASQLVPDLTAAMRFLHTSYGQELPSMVCLETGPSRTGDIERILVLGAHGPKKLTVILLLEDASAHR